MKIVVNHDWSYFEIPTGFSEKYNIPYYSREARSKEIRINPNLISYVENMTEDERDDDGCALEVIEIPDNATDWQIDEADGFESVIYVVDGKIHWSD